MKYLKINLTDLKKTNKTELMTNNIQIKKILFYFFLV